MIRRPPRSTQSRSSAASDVYKRQLLDRATHGRGARWAGGYPEAHYRALRPSVQRPLPLLDGFPPASHRWRGARRASLAPALLPAVAALGNGAQVPGGLRNAGDPAARYYGGVGRGAPAHGVKYPRQTSFWYGDRVVSRSWRATPPGPEGTPSGLRSEPGLEGTPSASGFAWAPNSAVGDLAYVYGSMVVSSPKRWPRSRR